MTETDRKKCAKQLAITGEHQFAFKQNINWKEKLIVKTMLIFHSQAKLLFKVTPSQITS